jgi:hypothetical protein
MTRLTLTRGALKSRVVRELIGERTIDLFQVLNSDLQSGDSGDGIVGFLRAVLNVGSKLVGFLVGVVTRSLNVVWDIVVDATFTILNFNFLQSDADIDSQIKANNLAIAAAAGQLAGTGSVWLASVGVAGYATLTYPVLAGQVALRLAEEGGEEIRAQLRGFLTSVRQSLVQNAILSLFKAGRGFLRWAFKKTLGYDPIPTKGSWSIAEQIEESVNSIPSDTIRVFVQNFLEASGDALIEVGYVVSNTVDDFHAASRSAAQEALGQQRAVRLLPDNRLEESVILTGPQTLIQQDIRTAIVQHNLIWNRDVGQIVGQPVEDYLRTRTQRRKLTIVFKSKEKPPWKSVTEGESVKEVTATIPEAKVGLSWQEIKMAAKKWLWGKFRCTCNLSDGRQIAVYGATGEEAENKARELLTLSTLDILTVSVSEERERNPSLRKHSTMMYPAYATLLVKRSITDLSGRADIDGNNWQQEKRRIDLWMDEPPANMEAFP